ncbi:uncharacterized protein LOC144867965 [Branchiostoma floridae x Branchiostoma japonicum]
MFARMPRRRGLTSPYEVQFCAVAPLPLLARGFDTQSCRYPVTCREVSASSVPLTNREFLELYYTASEFDSNEETVCPISLSFNNVKYPEELRGTKRILLEWLHVFGDIDTTGRTEKQMHEKASRIAGEFERLAKNYNARYKRGGWTQWNKMQAFLESTFEWGTYNKPVSKEKTNKPATKEFSLNVHGQPSSSKQLECGVAVSQLPGYPDVPPPSYNEAMRIPSPVKVFSSPMNVLSAPIPSVVTNDINDNQRKPLGVLTNSVRTRSGIESKATTLAEVKLKKQLAQCEKAKKRAIEENNSLKRLVGCRTRDIARERDEAQEKCDQVVQRCSEQFEKEMQKLNEELKKKDKIAEQWKEVAEEMMDSLNEDERLESKKESGETMKLQRKLQRKDDRLKKMKNVVAQKERLEKRIQRKEDEVKDLKKRIQSAENNIEEEREAAEAFYEGIIYELEEKLQNAEDKEKKMEETVASLRNLETKCGKAYTAEVRLVYYHLLTLGVSANIIEEVVSAVLKNLTDINTDNIMLPKRTTAQRLKVEAGYLATVKGFTTWAMREDKAIAYQSDHTTRGQLHWLSHKIVLSATEEETIDRVFSLSIAPVHNETAEATVTNLTETFNDLQEVGNILGIDGSFAHVGQIKTHMKDRAAVETKVTRLLEDLKGDKLHETVPGWHLLSPEEQDKRKKIYGFTCAAHKIQNVAEAMSKAAQKNLKYDVEKEGKARRGMVGAKDHIYATAKLLCMETKKEYAEGKEFCGFALLHTELEDSGQKLFQPIVGNRFLVFFQNAIPCFVGKEMIQLYLTDKKLQKGNFNRLEETVYNGYFNANVMAEERAYSIMYYEVCLPLFSKCQEAGSPLDMNRYYQVAHDKLTEWANDATALFEGSEPLWSQCRSADLQEYMLKVRQPHDTDDMTKETLSAMCKAGAEKLKQHAFEHLRGGEYHNPTTEHKEAAQLIGDATNLRIEQDFGILAQQQVVSPAANPLVHSAMVRAKQDKPAEWLASQPEQNRENLCSLARKGARKLRKQWGTKEEQLKRLYEAEEPRRKEKKRKRDESLKRKQEKKLAFVEALRESRLVVDPSKVNKMKGKDINYQLSLWVELEKLSKGQMKHPECLKNRSKLKLDAKKAAIRKLIRHNSHFVSELDDHLPLSVHRSRTAHQDSEWEEDDNLPLSAQVRRVAVPSGHDDSDWEDEDDLPLTTVMDWYDSDMSDCADAD